MLPPVAPVNAALASRTAECSTAATTTWAGARMPGDHRSPGGRGDGLGGPAGEDDLAGAGTEQVGDLLAGLLERDAAGQPFGVDAARVGGHQALEAAPVEHGHHGVARLGPQRRGRRVVEVVPRLGHASTAVTQTSSPMGIEDDSSGDVSP